ncbi:PspC domain-containing protein [Alloscardovia venturai]|uniref:PspC domain-containing protein n=1 Tax=Alloscardovia venturai TaxID=1769421 RepID=A0ABW2Y1X1_9BIFI
MNNDTGLSKFFDWIRSSQIVRGDDRWIGGVCAGIARRVGWDRALVRALALLLILTGSGILAYVFAWLLLPDTHGRILFEEMIRGNWSGEAVVSTIFLVIAGMTTFLTFWGMVTVLLFFVLVAYSSRQARNPENWQTVNDMQQPQPSHLGPQQPGPQSQQYQDYTHYTQPQAAPWQPYNHDTAYYATPPTQSFPAQPSSAQGTAAQPTPRVQPVVPRIIERERVVYKRKSAGPVLRLLVLAAVLFSIAATYFVGKNVLHIASTDFVNLALLVFTWFACLTIGLFVVTLVLALMGRKSAGYGTAAGLCLVLCLGSLLPAYGALAYEAGTAANIKSYSTVVLTKENTTIKASKSFDKQLQQGVAFTSSGRYRTRNVTIDLRNWKDVEGTHKHKKVDGTWVDSGCPTGHMGIYARAVNVTVKLPRGCGYNREGLNSFGAGWSDNLVGNSAADTQCVELAEQFRRTLQDYVDSHDRSDESTELVQDSLADLSDVDSESDLEDWLQDWKEKNLDTVVKNDFRNQFNQVINKTEKPDLYLNATLIFARLNVEAQQ